MSKKKIATSSFPKDQKLNAKKNKKSIKKNRKLKKGKINWEKFIF